MEAPSIPPISIPQPQKTKRFPVVIMVVLLLVGLVVGGLIGYAVTYSDFNGKLSSVQAELQGYSQNGNSAYSNVTYVIESNVSLSSLYQQVKSSVIVIQDIASEYGMFGNLVGYSIQQGSGFITKVNNQLVVVTNNHVIENAINETVTFADGKSYPATVLGSDAKADLAVLTVSSMPSGVTPLTLVSSETLQVGDPVVAVGSPYGLSGTLTTGVISALGRTITEVSSSSQSSGQTIPDMIQTSTAINSGNSGGPLINYAGEVVGITTAAVSNSEGLGFAIPSATIIRELSSLVTSGSYNQHPTIDATGTDMNYQIAQAMGTSITYGWLVESVSTQNGLKGGTTQTSILGSNVIIGGDIIIAINGNRITNTDDLLSYIEQHTLPGQTVDFTVVRSGQTQTVSVTIEKLS
jgi:S1-C subfamily serine protease